VDQGVVTIDDINYLTHPSWPLSIQVHELNKWRWPFFIREEARRGVGITKYASWAALQLRLFEDLSKESQSTIKKFSLAQRCPMTMA